MANQTKSGKAFEYACLKAFETHLKANNKNIEIKDDAAPFQTAKKSYENLSASTRQKYDNAAKTAVKLIFPLEPRLENGSGTIRLSLNADKSGEKGDVRDLLCIRVDDKWEIGFSCKHNHEALKHPRLTKDGDFGKIWIGHPCSEKFLQEISEVRKNLSEKKENALFWNKISNKHEIFYLPILKAFERELKRLCETYEDSCEKLLEYFFGNKDFYKIISQEKNRQTKIEGFNMYGTMNMVSGEIKPIYKVKKLKLPTKLYDIHIKQGESEHDKTTLLVTFDGGWTISMRLHNKDSKATITSLAWDVSLAGMPPDLYQQQRSWDE